MTREKCLSDQNHKLYHSRSCGTVHSPKSLVKFEMYLASYYTGSRMGAKTLIKDTKGLNDTMQIKEKLVEGYSFISIQVSKKL